MAERDPNLEDDDVDALNEGEDEAEGNEAGQGGDDDKAAIEARARKQGWVPEDEWDEEYAERRGVRKPAKFKSAEEFLKATEDNPAMERERLRRATETIERLEGKLDEMGKVFDEQRKLSREAQQRAYEKGLAEAQAKRREAIADGDVEEADKAQEKIDELKAKTAELIEGEQPQGKKPVDPRIKEWIEKNPWFTSDPVRGTLMEETHKRLVNENPGVPQAELLEDAKAIVREKFPERFGARPNPRREGRAGVSAPSGQRKPAGNGNGRSWSDVPEDARQAYERQRKMMKSTRGVDFTKEEYMADYFGY